MTKVQQIYTYPLKSAAGGAVQACTVDAIGLAGDRRWMLIDPNGRFVTGRVLGAVVLLHARAVEDGLALQRADGVSLVARADARAVPVQVEIWKDTVAAAPVQPEVDGWLSETFGRPLRLVHLAGMEARSLARKGIDGHVSFADAYPLLLTSQTSLDALTGLVGRPMDMRRFRPNLVVEGSAAWSEEAWRRIRIGQLHFRVINRCERCIFTTVDPDTGQREADREPLATLERARRFSEGACFGINVVPELPFATQTESDGPLLSVGDPITVLEQTL